MASAPGPPSTSAETYVSGFGSLASFIAIDDDHLSAVYKRFDRLSTRNILYYQSELSHLQAQQDGYDIQDSIDIENDNRPDAREHRSWIRKCAGSWDEFEKAASHPNPASHGSVTRTQPDEMWRERMDLAMKIRVTLKEYQEALIRESKLVSLHPPSQQAMTVMSNYFHRNPTKTGTTLTPPGGSAPSTYSMLSGASSSLYPLGMGTTHTRDSDYVSLTGRDEPDLLTRILNTTLARFFPNKPPPVLPQYRTPSCSCSSSSSSSPPGTTISHLSPGEFQYYSYEHVKIMASLITTLTAVMLLFLPIFALYHTNSSRPQLSIGLIAMFSVVFAAALRAMTTATRVEIFGACAAYAAVLVVFISGDFAGGGSSGTVLTVPS